YVALIADGALARTREALRMPARSRVHVAASPSPKAVPLPAAIGPAPEPARPVARDASQAPTPARAKAEPIPEPVQRRTAEARTGVAQPFPADPKPATRALGAPGKPGVVAPVAEDPSESEANPIDALLSQSAPSTEARAGPGWRALAAGPSGRPG